MNYTIWNAVSGWFDKDNCYPSAPPFKRDSKAHRFFRAEDCFTNEEPFIDDPDEGPIKFYED